MYIASLIYERASVYSNSYNIFSVSVYIMCMYVYRVSQEDSLIAIQPCTTRKVGQFEKLT